MWAALVLVACSQITPTVNLKLTGTVTVVDYRNGTAAWADQPKYPHVGDAFSGELLVIPGPNGRGHVSMGPWEGTAAVQFFSPSTLLLGSLTYEWAFFDLQFKPTGNVGEMYLCYDGTPVPEPLGYDFDAGYKVTFSYETRLVGDSNLDGMFNSGDIIHAFQYGEYEDTIARNSSFVTGDWNADQEFNTNDFVAAFQLGQYEMPAPTAVAVPEPSAVFLAIIGLLMLISQSCRSL